MADGAAWRTRAARSFAFARHIPPAKILRRVLLAGRGKVERAVRWAPVSASAKLAEVAPLPPLAQRANSARHESGNWFFTFIGRSETCPGEAIDWHLGGAGPKNQLWRMNLHYFEWVEGVDDSAFRQALIDWLAANPPFAPGARHDAWNSYALSLRVVVWLQQLAVRRGRLDPAWVGEMANQLLGRVKSQSLARGVAFRLGTPVVIAGTCLEIAGAVPNHIVLTFLGEHGPLRVSLELVAAPTLKLRDDPGEAEAAEGRLWLF